MRANHSQPHNSRAGLAAEDIDDDNAPWTPEDGCLLGLSVTEQEELVNQRTYRESADALNVVLRLWPRSTDEDEMEDIGT